MRGLVFVLVVVVTVANAIKPELVIGYHDNIGIPLAKEIYEAESAALAESEAKAGVGRNADVLEGRIIGGVITPVNAHPYMAGLVISFWNVAGQSACGSTLVSANRLITAAHCWNDGFRQARQFEVVLASQFLFFGGTRISTEQVFMHPGWNTFNVQDFENDIAMIYLPWNVPLSNSIMPAALPEGAEEFETFAGQWAVAVGFGVTSDSQGGVTTQTQLRHVMLSVMTTDACRSIYASVVRDSHLCTSGSGRVGICGGDSGGPLVVDRGNRNVLVGISCFAASGACEGGWPSGFTRVTSHLGFIRQHMSLW